MSRSSTPVVLIALVAMGATLWGFRDARGDTAAGNPVLQVPISGKVKGPTGTVVLSGAARVGTSVTGEPLFGDPPSVVVSIDPSGITGSGPSGKKYQVSGEEHLVRPLVESDSVEAVFLYHPAGDAAGSESQPVTLSFHLRFDMNRHGALLHADGGIASAGQ